jgi:hypothetical protein
VVFEKVPQTTNPALPHSVATPPNSGVVAEKQILTGDAGGRAEGVMVWGTAVYLVGIVALLTFLGSSLAKRYRMVATGQRILYEGK